MFKINGNSQAKIGVAQPARSQTKAPSNTIMQFENYESATSNTDVSDKKLETEMFKEKLLEQIDESRSDKSRDTIKYYLGKIISIIQKLNGVSKNNLKPQGTPEQNEMYNSRIKEQKTLINQYVSFIGAGLSIVQDDNTGLYKINIDNKIFNVPERNVEIRKEYTEDGYELMLEIVD